MSTIRSLASRSGEGFEENAGAYEGLVEELRDRMREARREGSEKRAVLWCVRIDDSPEGDGELASFSSPPLARARGEPNSPTHRVLLPRSGPGSLVYGLLAGFPLHEFPENRVRKPRKDKEFCGCLMR